MRYWAVAALAISLGCAQGTSGGDDDTTGGADARPAGNPADASPGGNPADAMPGGGGADAAPVGGACDPVAQTGCHVSQKCAWIYSDLSTGAGTPGCWPNGTKAVGAACSAPAMVGQADDCVKGAHCVFGTCKEICLLTPPSPCSAGGCVGVEGLDFDVCLPNCDPLTQNCALGDGCYLTAEGPVCADVIGAGVPAGGACMYLNDCAAGAGCFDDGLGGGICYNYCNFSMYPNVRDPTYCATGEVCTGITGEATYGVCT